MRFSIRDLFLVILVVGLSLGWWLDRSRLAKQIDELESDLLRTREKREIAELFLKGYRSRLPFPQ